MFKVLVVSSLLFLPLTARAEVVITEIMYDLPGTDTGREWIEVLNEGSDSVDLSVFKLFEANTNHKLTLVQGEATLSAGAYSVIADNAEKFLIDNPGYSGALFDSAFSLANTSETLVLKNGDTEEDSVTYSSETGAVGDGQTLQLIGSGWNTGNPTPGTSNTASAPTPPEDGEDEEKESATSTPIKKEEEQKVSGAALPQEPVDDLGIPLSLTVKVGSDRTVTVGAAEYFRAQAYRKSGPEEKKARYRWNFGNGFMRHEQELLFQYNYPGTYVAVVTAQGPNEAKAFARFTVTAAPAHLSVARVDASGIAVRNGDTRELNLSLWSLRAGEEYFLLPEDTILLPGAEVVFPSEVTGLDAVGTVALVYPNGKDAAVYGAQASAEVTPPVKALSVSRSLTAPQVAFEPVVTPAANSTYTQDSALLAVAGAATLPRESEDPIPWFLGFVTILTLGLTALFIIRNKASGLRAENFTIIDATPELDTYTQPLSLEPGKREEPKVDIKQKHFN